MDKITDHDARLKSLLPSQYAGLPNWEAYLTAFAKVIQGAEDDGYKFLTELALPNAVGVQLDGLGEILGEERKGRNDDDYRAFLGIRVTINISRGEPETLISVLAAITDSSYVALAEVFPARVEMYFNGATIPSDLLNNMNLVKAAGVQLALYNNGGETPFVTEGDLTGLGFSDVGFENGGALVEVYE